MPTNPNLDALIPRDDFDVKDERESSGTTFRSTVEITSLEQDTFFYASLRKPDFQRETADWSPERIRDFILTFLDGDLVPAVILWKSGELIFVIDGAHRLSALIAWVQDDYGNGNLSRHFYGDTLSPEQAAIAAKTRDLVNETVGPYRDYKHATQHPDPTHPEMMSRARRMGSTGITVQWVPGGDSKKAEESFMRINQSAVQISDTEISIIKARAKPNGLATRAVIHAGTGHKYWSSFEPEVIANIEKISREIYDILFDPRVVTPIKTLDLPIAGNGYSPDSLRLVFEYINLVNDVKPEMRKTDRPASTKPRKGPISTPSRLEDDKDGTDTVTFLKEVRRLSSRISGGHPSSLGLHPAVYFYSLTGKYQPAAFLATAAFIKDLSEKDDFFAFTEVRNDFEEFLLRHKYFVNQIVRQAGGWTKSVTPLKSMYEVALSGVRAGLADEEIIGRLQASKGLKVLDPAKEEEKTGKFSTDIKSAAFLRDALDKAVRCKICGARIHFKSISFDHVERKQDGGASISENAQLTHPYCNTGFKERQHHLSKQGGRSL